jgi:hypothetical protein
MAATILPNAKSQFIDSNGKPLAGGTVYFYIPNTSTFKSTWQDPAQTILNTNPIVLDANGQALIWGSGVYRQVVYDQFNNLIWDQITEDTSSGLIGNMTDNVYLSGTGFTPGTTTTLTLSSAPGSPANMWVFFDGIYQTPDTWSVSGAVVTFNTAIPIGINEVNIKVGNTIAIGTPGAGTITDASVAANAGIQSSKLTYTPPGAPTGAGVRTIQSKEHDIVSVMDFLAKGDGITDDTNAFRNALAYLGAAGGQVLVPPGLKFLINSSLTIPANCSLTGPYNFVGSPGNNSSAPYGNLGALILNPSVTITLGSNSGIEGCLIYPKNMTFPQTTPVAWSGTAVTFSGDDGFIDRCMIIGFNQIIYGTGVQRPRIKDLYFDGVNGIWIDNSKDVDRIIDCHGWPFATIAGGGGAIITRSGIAYNFTTENDDMKVRGCFAYGYVNSFVAANCVGGQFVDCTADGTTVTGTTGFTLTNCTNTNLIGIQSSGQQIGCYVNNGIVSELHALIVGSSFWGNIDEAILINAGDVMILGNHIRQGTNGVSINNANSLVVIDSNRFQDQTSLPVNSFVSTQNVIIGQNDYGALPPGNLAVNSNVGPYTLASATLLNLPANNSMFTITGTTSIGGIAGGWCNREITLLFTASCTLGNSGSSPNGVSLSGGTSFNAVNGSTITLKHNGTLWYEIGRKAS